MRDILGGGILVTRGSPVHIALKPALARRRRPTRARNGACAVPPPPASTVQPGQLAWPVLPLGFPSLSLH